MQLTQAIKGYRIFARAEGRSKRTIEGVGSSVAYFDSFLRQQGMPTDVREIGANEIRAFILSLQDRERFVDHPFNHGVGGKLSGATIHTYLKNIRAFWNWLEAEGEIETNPFAKIKIPREPRKIMPTFSEVQLESLLKAAQGSYRDTTMILLMLDAGIRVSEMVNLTLEDVWLDEGLLRVWGKGNKERLVPFGKSLQRILWVYLAHHRPQPLGYDDGHLFLTRDGLPLKRQRVGQTLRRLGQRAGISGIRCSPHTLRHTFVTSFLRNNGGPFHLQQALGHATLAMTRHYCNLVDADIKEAHLRASPVDNLVARSRAIPIRRAGKPRLLTNGRKAVNR